MLNYLLWAIIGWGLSSAVLLRVFWMPDPPPDWLRSYLAASFAGIVGGIGGGLAASLVQSDPMPGIVGAIAGALAFVAIVRGISGATSAAR